MGGGVLDVCGEKEEDTKILRRYRVKLAALSRIENLVAQARNGRLAKRQLSCDSFYGRSHFCCPLRFF